MRFFPLLVVLLAMAGCATPPKPAPITLNWAGLYDNKATLSLTPGIRPKLDAIVPLSRLIARQDRIPAQTGILFGLNFTIPGAVAGDAVALRQVIRFPTPGLTNPQGQLLAQSEKSLAARTGHPLTIGYRFRDWEVKEGEWVFEVWRDRELLLSKSFYVTQNEPVPAEQPAFQRLEDPQCPLLSYPENARKQRVEGQTQVLFTIRGNGIVEDVSLLARSGATQAHALLDTTVIQAYKSCRFNAVQGIELYYAGQAVNWVLK